MGSTVGKWPENAVGLEDEGLHARPARTTGGWPVHFPTSQWRFS